MAISPPIGAFEPSESLLPVSYADTTVVCAIYTVPVVAGHRALEHTKLHPLIVPGNRSVVVVTLFDFRTTSIGPYREFSVGILAVPEQRARPGPLNVLRLLPTVGSWIVALPVTSDLACSAGTALYGYPKTVNRIDVQYSTNQCRALVQDGSLAVVSFDAPLRAGPRIPVPRLLTYSRLDQALVETAIPCRWFPRLSSGRGVRMDLLSSDHPIAQTIAALQLPSQPTFLLHGDGFEATLNLGKRNGS